jgi:hypothetical protein
VRVLPRPIIKYNRRKVNPILRTFEGLTACASKRLEPGHEDTHTQYDLYAGRLVERDHDPHSELSHNLSLLHAVERSCVNARTRVKARPKLGRRRTEPSRPVLDGDVAFGVCSTSVMRCDIHASWIHQQFVQQAEESPENLSAPLATQSAILN